MKTGRMEQILGTQTRIAKNVWNTDRSTGAGTVQIFSNSPPANPYDSEP